MGFTRFCNAFVKITGWPVQFFAFRTKIFYEDRSVQGRKIQGPAILVSNHTSVYDYAVYIFVFITRTLRVVMAEVLFEKPLLGWFLRSLGGIKVDRNTHDFGFVAEAEAVLAKGGVVGIFPESRLPKEGEERPLPFKDSAAYIALRSGAPVIPVVTDGSYFRRKRAHVLIGKPIDLRALSAGLTEKEAVQAATKAMRDTIIDLKSKLNEMVL